MCAYFVLVTNHQCVWYNVQPRCDFVQCQVIMGKRCFWCYHLEFSIYSHETTRWKKKNTIPFAKHKKDIDQTFTRDGEKNVRNRMKEMEQKLKYCHWKLKLKSWREELHISIWASSDKTPKWNGKSRNKRRNKIQCFIWKSNIIKKNGRKPNWFVNRGKKPLRVANRRDWK